MTTRSPTTAARRKAARALLRDAQLPDISSRSRAVLAIAAMQVCTQAVFEDVYELWRASGNGTDAQWNVTCEALIASAKEILKSR